MVDCWPIFLRVVHHIHHTVIRHVGHRIVRHVVVVPKLVKVIVCAGGIAVAPPVAGDHDKGATIQIFLPPQFIYPPEVAKPPVTPSLVPWVPTVRPIPEPGTLIVLGGAVMVLSVVRTRKPA